MKTISKEITGNLIVNENTTFHNVLAETVIVEKGITARFFGSVNKQIIVKSDAIAYLHGNLFGKVINEGGTVHVFPPNGKVQSFTPQEDGER